MLVSLSHDAPGFELALLVTEKRALISSSPVLIILLILSISTFNGVGLSVLTPLIVNSDVSVNFSVSFFLMAMVIFFTVLSFQ